MKTLVQILGDTSVKNVNNFLSETRPTRPNPDGSPIFLKSKKGDTYIRVTSNDNCTTVETESPYGIMEQCIGDFYLAEVGTYIEATKDEFINALCLAQDKIQLNVID